MITRRTLSGRTSQTDSAPDRQRLLLRPLSPSSSSSRVDSRAAHGPVWDLARECAQPLARPRRARSLRPAALVQVYRARSRTARGRGEAERTWCRRAAAAVDDRFVSNAAAPNRHEIPDDATLSSISMSPRVCFEGSIAHHANSKSNVSTVMLRRYVCK